MRISVYSSKELQAIIVAMKALDRDTAKQIRAQTKKVVAPAWQKAVAENAASRLESRVLVNTARVRVTDQNVTLTSATIGRKLSGGLLPSRDYFAAEFGADQSKKTTYQATSKKGKRYSVTRRTTQQLRPRKQSGYVVYPAIAEIIPRIAALWTQTTVRGLHEAFEKR